MPTYEYACTKCGETLEAVQSFSDAPLTKCPACKGKLRKVFSPVGVVFKGSGFYKTDSRNGSSSTTAASDAKADSSSSDSSSTAASNGSPAPSSSPSSTSDPAASASKPKKAEPAKSGSKGDGSKVA
ncbi:MAG TPA: FmdB family zinc ribbon protein [Mycobacteriales bacterium]|nr:FmdB family zinc ribbon protein [Mycobacteriales bacterium]